MSDSEADSVAFAGAFAVPLVNPAMDGCLDVRAMGAERRGGKERVTMPVVVAERKNHGGIEKRELDLRILKKNETSPCVLRWHYFLLLSVYETYPVILR